ncbi:divalent-cation tolerance protein CutA [Endozoicomonas atrinae]|uniref:divalent-cation tolerance protein CutA n=1 Tax=Endozoicomonas atrinae TaxID=1333660 RepID=UPI0008244587|nr:divalent-cation tolerance protein CutA [Endozoicomonas atrinae]
MNQNNTFCMVLTTCPNQQEADAHARAIIEKHLGACVQSSPVHSHYMWEGKVQSDPEILLRIKTTCERYKALEQYLKAEHSYDVPQIIKIPIENGLTEYLDWIKEETTVK